MPGKDKSQNSAAEDRRRNPSRPAKGTVGDIAEVFKRQMATTPNMGKSTMPERKQSERIKANKELKESKKIEKEGEKTSPSSQEEDNLVSEEEIEVENAIDNHDNVDNSQNETEISRNENQLLNDEEGSEESLNVSQENKRDNEFDKNKGNKQSNENEEGAADQSKHVYAQKSANAENAELRRVLNEINGKLDKMDKALFDPKNGVEVLLAKTISKVSDIHSEIHGAVSGIKVRLQKVEEESSTNHSKMEKLETSMARLSKLLDENKRITQQLTLMQGMIQKFSQHGATTSAKITDLTKRGMEQNIIIYGINESSDKTKENCRKSIIEFLQEHLEIEVEEPDIWKAHRLGYKKENFVRPMVTKLAYHTKEKVMQNLGKLKGKVNQINSKPLFISEQVPEAVTEARKQVSARLPAITRANEELPVAERKQIFVHNDKIVVDGKVVEPDIITPQPSELFLDAVLQKKVDEINQNFVMSDGVQVKNSEFIALAMKVDSTDTAKLAYKAAIQRFPAMDHVMAAYAFKENGTVKMGHCDDGEYGGGMVIRRSMAELKAKDTMVFVVRRFGGLHLGIDRFKAIETTSKQALRMLKQSN